MDIKIRQAERSGDSLKILRAKLRAGLLVPRYTDVREVVCRGTRGGGHKKGCVGTRDYDPQDMLRLMAHLGDESAQMLVTNHPSTDWWGTMQHLASKLPDVRTTVKCNLPGPSYSRDFQGPKIHYEWYHTILNCKVCGYCQGTGYLTQNTSAIKYFSIIAAHAIARKMPQEDRITWALDACAAWIKCPCIEHETDWDRLGGTWEPEWMPVAFNTRQAVLLKDTKIVKAALLEIL